MGYHPSVGFWGHGNCAKIPSIPNYAKAQEHYNSVVPIRGRNPEVRPLGSMRRYTWYSIEKNNRVVEDGFLGQYTTTYSCKLFGTDCVEYYPDGKIAIRTAGWHTPTTMAFINYVTQMFGYIESVKGKWYWNQTHDSKKFLISKTTKDLIMLSPDADGHMIVEEPVKEKKYVISRKAMNVVRKKYEFFRDYCTVMLSMNDSIERTEQEEASKGLGLSTYELIGTEHWRLEDRRKDSRDTYFAHMDDVVETGNVELMYSLAIVACYSFGRWSYRNNTSRCSPEQFNRQWNEVLKYKFFNEITVAQDVEAGVGFKDPNTKYL